MYNKFYFIQPLSLFGDCKYFFFNPLQQREQTLKIVKGKSGIYCWFNKINGKFYVGSAISLNNRINDYFQESYLKNKKDLNIVRALTLYGMENFSLLILEITNKEDLLIREQYYLDNLKPKYNVLSQAGNSAPFRGVVISILQKLLKNWRK